MQPRKEQTLRCAIYTRKSSEEGLEQEFNSLHAQREACEAYIRSQQGEGWRLRKTSYNDGGLSGATMERPALKQLLAERSGPARLHGARPAACSCRIRGRHRQTYLPALLRAGQRASAQSGA